METSERRVGIPSVNWKSQRKKTDVFTLTIFTTERGVSQTRWRWRYRIFLFQWEHLHIMNPRLNSKKDSKTPRKTLGTYHPKPTGSTDYLVFQTKEVLGCMIHWRDVWNNDLHHEGSFRSIYTLVDHRPSLSLWTYYDNSRTKDLGPGGTNLRVEEVKNDRLKHI